MHQPSAAVLRAGTALATGVLTVAQKRQIFINALDHEHVVAPPLKAWDKLPKGHIRDSASAIGTILEPGVKALQEAGVPMDDTMGAIKRELNATDEDLHWAGCNCFITSETMPGRTSAARLRKKFAEQ